MSDERQAMLAAVRASKLKIAESRAMAVAANAPAAPETAESLIVSRSASSTFGSNQLHVKDSRGHFVSLWAQKVQAFVDDAAKLTMELPADLNGYDRKALHELATKFNLRHMSEGFGTDRHLVLKKDALFFAIQVAGPSTQDITDLQQRPVSRRERKELRDELDDKALYADRSAIKHYQKFRAATNPNARAIDSEFSPQDLLAIAVDGPRSLGNSAAQSAAIPALDPAESGKRPRSDTEQGGDGGSKSFVEVCSRCGATNPIDFDVSEWDNNGFCERCGRETIWTLRQDTSKERPTTRGARKESAAAVAATAMPETTRDDVLAAAQLYELPDADVAWLRSLPGKDAASRISFSLALSDLGDAVGKASKQHLAAGEQRSTYWIKASMPDAAAGPSEESGASPELAPHLSGRIASLLSRFDPAALVDWFVCFPAMAALGMPLECAVALVVDSRTIGRPQVVLAVRQAFGALGSIVESPSDL